MSGAASLRRLRSLLFRLEAVLALCIAWFLVFRVPSRLFGINRRGGALTAHARLVTGEEPVLGGVEATGFTPNACLYASPRTL